MTEKGAPKPDDDTWLRALKVANIVVDQHHRLTEWYDPGADSYHCGLSDEVLVRLWARHRREANQ